MGLTTEIYGALRFLTSDVRGEALDAIERWSGSAGPCASTCVVSADELVELGRSDVIEIGSHSSTHPFLTRVPVEVQRREIRESRSALEQLLGHRVDLFSYPNGSRDDGTDTLLEAAGYRAACASQPGVTTADSDPFSLPRFWPVDRPDDVDRVIGRWL